jgi:single-strand DNA-binding protein
MSGVNQITIVGNLGSSAPELSYGQNNVAFCRFSVAVNEQWKSDGEKREKVTWFSVLAFNGLAETCANYLKPGRLVAIQGRVQTREYEDREGTRHQVMQVVAEKVTFLGAAKREERDDRQPPTGEPVSNGREQSSYDSDVPF